MEALTFKNIRVGHVNAFLPSVWFLINAGIFSLFRLYLFDNGGLWMRVSKRPIVSSYKPRSKFPSFIHGQNNSIRRFYMNLISEVIAIKGITDSRFNDEFMVPGRFLKSAFKTSGIGFQSSNWWWSTPTCFNNPPEVVLEF